MNIINCDYIGATGNYPIEEELLSQTLILDNKINNTSNDLNIKIYNTSNNLQSNITILKNELWDVNSNNSNGIIKYTYENYQQYNAINTTIYINENANSKIIFRSRFNNSQLQHNTEIRSDGKLYIYIDGNILPPIIPAWYNVGDTFEGIFIKDTEQDAAILGFGGALAEQQSLILQLSTQVQAMDHMFLASSVLASSPNLVSIGTELTNFALWQYVTGTFIAGLGAVAIGSAVIATRAEGLANMINASYISSNALNAINLNSNISSNDRLIFTSNLENIKFINNQLIASNLYDFNILTGNINTNIITSQYIPNLNTSNLTINNININDIITSNKQWSNIDSNIYYNTGSVGIGITTPTQKLEVAGNIKTQQLYINNPNSTASIFFSPTPSIYSIFSKKVPWGMYFAEDFNTTTNILPNYISNGRDATTTGTITKTTANGNGATGNITYISGGTGATMAFPTGSIPTNFTILSLTRYNGATRGRILQAQSVNFLHGHHGGDKNVCYYNKWITSTIDKNNVLDWLCCIGKNGGSVPNNIICDGIGKGIDIGGTGNSSLRINSGSVASQTSDWALSCVMIWDTHLTDEEMFDLNTIINNYKTDGISIKSLLSAINDDECVIESRVYGGTEKTELLFFKGNDPTGTNGADRIRLRSANIAFDTYSTTTTDRNTENIKMLINQDGNVGIGTITPSQKLEVVGTIKTNELIINDLNFNTIIYNSSNAIINNVNANFNTIINNTSNGIITIINNTSNAIISNVNTNLNNNFSKISRVFIPNTLFVYDTTNSCYTYDLDISKYINYDLVYGGLGNPIYFKTRIFKINSYMSTDWLNLDFNNKNHLSGNAICFPETLTIFMSNNYYYNNIHTAPDNYCNGIILGKLNEKSSGYWNIIPNNFNYIRFISAQGFDMKIIIQPLTQN